mgnify:CR=1 FL=1
MKNYLAERDVTNGNISYGDKNILSMSTTDVAREGIFLVNQNY